MGKLIESEGPVIVLKGGRGVALYETVPYSPYFYKSVRVGHHAVLHPDGQVDMHGTPSEEGTFQLAGHWLENNGRDIQLLIPRKRPQSLALGFWRDLLSILEDEEIPIHRRGLNLALPRAKNVIVFGQVLIAPHNVICTRIYHLDDVEYRPDTPHRFPRIRNIPVSSPPPVPVSP